MNGAESRPRKCLIAAGAVALATLAWTPGQAQAMEQGHCIPAQNFEATLQQEGQGILATMDTIVVNRNGDTEYRAERVTTNANGSRGYVFAADAGLEDEASRHCVSQVLRNVEINDYRFHSDGPPTVRQFEFSEEDALRQCDDRREEMGQMVCGHRGTIIENAESQDNHRLAIQALAEDEEGVARSLFTVLASPDAEQRYSVLTTADQGATAIFDSGIRFTFADPIIAWLDQQRGE